MARKSPKDRVVGPLPNGIFMVCNSSPARWAPIDYKWSYNPYKWPYKWVTGVITPISGVITLLITGDRGPPCGARSSKDIYFTPEGLEPENDLFEKENHLNYTPLFRGTAKYAPCQLWVIFTNFAGER